MSVEEKYIAHVERLIPRPDIVFDILSMVNNSDVNISDIVKKAESDPHLVANMLRMANSAYFGCVREISSVHDIVVRLGFENLKILAITSAAGGLLKSSQSAYNLQPRMLWHHSYACAILATIMGRYTEAENIFSIYTAALLHDVGKVILNKPFEDARLSTKTDRQFPSMVDYEHFMLQTDHARTGSALLEKWNLPADIIVPVRDHHSSAKLNEKSLYSKIIYLTDLLVNYIGVLPTSPGQYEFSPEDFLEKHPTLPDVPNVMTNLPAIVADFTNQYIEATVGF